MNKFLTIATVAVGLLFATAGQSEARDHHHHGGHSHSSHHHGGHAYRGDVHRHYYGGYRGGYRGYRGYGYDCAPVYRPRYSYGGYCEPRRSITIFVPGIGYVLRSY